MTTNSKDRDTYTSFVHELNQFSTTASSEDYPLLTIIAGPSDYLVSKAGTYLQSFWRKLTDQPSYSLDAQEISAEQFRSCWEQDSLFEPRSLTLIRHIDKRLPDLVKWLADIPCVAAIRRPLCLSFVGRAKSQLDKQCLRLGGREIPCYEPLPRNLPTFVEALARKFDLQLDRTAANFLILNLGSDLWLLENEIKKLALLMPKGQQATVELISPHLGFLRDDHAFILSNHLLEGRLADAQGLLLSLLQRGESSLAILGLLTKHVRQALIAQSPKLKGTSPKNLATALGLPPFVASKYADYARKGSEATFLKALSLCVQADRYLKSSKIADDILLLRILSALP